MKQATAQTVIAKILEDETANWDEYLRPDAADTLAKTIVESPFFSELWEKGSTS